MFSITDLKQVVNACSHKTSALNTEPKIWSEIHNFVVYRKNVEFETSNITFEVKTLLGINQIATAYQL